MARNCKVYFCVLQVVAGYRAEVWQFVLSNARHHIRFLLPARSSPGRHRRGCPPTAGVRNLQGKNAVCVDMNEIYRSKVAILDGIRLRKKSAVLRRLFRFSGKKIIRSALFHNADREKWAAMAKAMDAVNDNSASTRSPLRQRSARRRIIRLSPRRGVRPG